MRALPLWMLMSCTSANVDSASSPCSEETRAQVLEAGAIFSGSTVTMSVTDMTPEPATAGQNTWTVALEAGSVPLSGCSLSAGIAMPDHGHGGPAPEAAEEGDGVYTLQVEYTMGGYWEMSLDISCDAVSDTVPVPVCVES